MPIALSLTTARSFIVYFVIFLGVTLKLFSCSLVAPAIPNPGDATFLLQLISL